MNVVFLLLTTAVSAGADAPAQIKPAAPPAAATPGAPIAAPIASNGCGCGGCGAISDCCSDSCGCCEKESWFSRMCSRFRKNSCCEAPACGCECGGGAVYSAAPTWGKHGGGCCGAVADCGCGCEETCCKPSLLDRLRACFARKHCCNECDTGCGGCGGCGNGSCGCGGAGAPAVGGAPVMTPGQVLPGTGSNPERLKMPKGEGDKGTPKNGGGKEKETTVPAAPVLTPTGAKIETEVKNPFELARRHELRDNRAAEYSKLTGQLYYVHADGGLWVLRYAPLSKEDANGGSVILARDRKMDSYREGDLVSVEGQVLSQKGSAHLGAPLYQVQSISLVDRPQP